MPVDDSPVEAAQVRRRLSDAFRRAYETTGMSQVQLADRIGTEQATVSKWARGINAPPLEVLPLVDQACGQPVGYVLRLAGLVADVIDARTAILTDEALPEDHRLVLVALYDNLVKAARLAPQG